MFSKVEKGLYAFWSQFGVPCYEQGNVPIKAQLPYITYNVGVSDTFEESLLTAFVYAKNSKDRRDILDLIAKEIPYGGSIVNLSPNNSKLWIKRNNTSFITYGEEIDDNSIIYGRISYLVEFLTL